jgi:hypothetical protein
MQDFLKICYVFIIFLVKISFTKSHLLFLVKLTFKKELYHKDDVSNQKLDKKVTNFNVGLFFVHFPLISPHIGNFSFC